MHQSPDLCSGNTKEYHDQTGEGMRTLKEYVKQRRQKAKDRTLGKAYINVENFRIKLESLKNCESSI